MAALKAADFKSLRGNFKYNTNNFPIQDLHVFEAVKDSQGRMTLKTVATPLKADKTPTRTSARSNRCRPRDSHAQTP